MGLIYYDVILSDTIKEVLGEVNDDVSLMNSDAYAQEDVPNYDNIVESESDLIMLPDGEPEKLETLIEA